VIGGLAGVFAGLLAIVVPLNFYASLFSNSGARQPNAQLDFWNGVGGSMVVMLLTVVLGFVSYILIRFSLTRPKSSPATPEN
jgi:hypothetical protein